MEDAKLSELELPFGSMCFGVFDGHGGKEVALYVAKHFCQQLISTENYKNFNFENALKETYLYMDQMIQTTEGRLDLLRIQRELPDDYEVSDNELDSFAGCTAVVALIQDHKIYVANAGDSRCVLAKEGKAIEMTMDHKPDNPEEHDRILRAGGSVDDGRVMGNLNLSRSIGDFEYKKNTEIPQEEQMITANPEVKVEDLTESCDFLVLACDGIWDSMSSQQCVDFIYERLREDKSEKETVEELLDRCLAPDVASSGGVGCDNMTCILINFKV